MYPLGDTTAYWYACFNAPQVRGVPSLTVLLAPTCVLFSSLCRQMVNALHVHEPPASKPPCCCWQANLPPAGGGWMPAARMRPCPPAARQHRRRRCVLWRGGRGASRTPSAAHRWTRCRGRGWPTAGRSAAWGGGVSRSWVRIWAGGRLLRGGGGGECQYQGPGCACISSRSSCCWWL
jgi:hypothetical protein